MSRRIRSTRPPSREEILLGWDGDDRSVAGNEFLARAVKTTGQIVQKGNRRRGVSCHLVVEYVLPMGAESSTLPKLVMTFPLTM
ncbi:MAG: hypothetical protein ACK4QL_02550 [Pseudanabaenaceae cyanobacterium]